LRERSPVWLQGVAFVLPNVAASMFGAGLGMLAPAPLSDAYIGMAISMPFVINIMASPRPIEAVAYMLLVSIGVTAICCSGWLGPAKNLGPAFQSSALSSIIALAWVCRAELLKRRSYLHALIARIRGDALALANARLEALSNTDALTGIGNRRQFDDRLDRAWQPGVELRLDTSSLLVDAADAALYLAKSQGQNRSVIADPASLAPPAPPRRLVFKKSA
jgi:predicted signal transduction protein with EAL and GGDEF domain